MCHSERRRQEAQTLTFICSHQVDPSASNLNTNDVFVLKSPSALYVWRGQGANDEEMEAAKHVVSFLGGSPSHVSENKEPGGCADDAADHRDLTSNAPQSSADFLMNE